jgi:DNA invertase Pin-like site-specific DNA recombinase
MSVKLYHHLVVRWVDRLGRNYRYVADTIRKGNSRTARSGVC